MIWLVIVLFLTGDPFTLILNYSNPCECFSYKYLFCFLTWDMNFYDHRSQLSPYSFQRIWIAPLIRETQSVFANTLFTRANMNHCPHFIRMNNIYKDSNISFQINCQAKEGLKSHLATSHKHRRAKFWKSSNFPISKYALLYEIFEFP